MTQNKFIEKVISALGSRIRSANKQLASYEVRLAFAESLDKEIPRILDQTQGKKKIKYNTRLGPPKRKTKHQDMTGYLVARMVANHYLQCFRLPSTGKGWVNNYEKRAITPYDRVCKVVADYYGVDLSSHTLRKAVNDVRTIRTTKSIRSVMKIRDIGN